MFFSAFLARKAVEPKNKLSGRKRGEQGVREW